MGDAALFVRVVGLGRHVDEVRGPANDAAAVRDAGRDLEELPVIVFAKE